jgi:hypothetical protein
LPDSALIRSRTAPEALSPLAATAATIVSLAKLR